MRREILAAAALVMAMNLSPAVVQQVPLRPPPGPAPAITICEDDCGPQWIETEMSKLSDKLVPPPSPVVPSLKPPYQRNVPSRQDGARGRAQQESKFKLVIMSNGTTQTGAVFSQNTWVTDTGEKVYELMIHCGSAAGVKKEQEYWIGKSTKIIKREKLERKDETEERVVVILPARLCEEGTTIMETSGSILYHIQSCSAQAAFDFENESKGKYR